MLHNTCDIAEQKILKDSPFEMLPDAILSDVFRQISNPQVTCLSNHFAPNSSFGIGCCGIVWRHCTTTHNLDRNNKFTAHFTNTQNAQFFGRLKQAGSLALSSFSRSGIQICLLGAVFTLSPPTEMNRTRPALP